MASNVKGRTTIRTAAVLFLASAIFEFSEFTAGVPLFGAIRTGVGAMAYHFIFIVLYCLIGLGLWTGKSWGYWTFMACTLLYTIDKVQLLLAPHTFYTYIMQQLTATHDIVAMLPKDDLIHYFTLAYIAVVLCWWGFALYMHLRRGYFKPGQIELP
jgi:hypothetical protein